MPQQRPERRRHRQARPEADGSVTAPEDTGLSNAMLRELASPPSPYEVRCHHCDTSFAPGTPKCIHCGMRLGRPIPIGEASITDPILASGEEEEEDERVRPGVGRNLIWVITAFAMLVGSALRACQ
jgi:hypothetical protein